MYNIYAELLEFILYQFRDSLDELIFILQAYCTAFILYVSK